MAAKPPVDLPVRWNLSLDGDGTAALRLKGELDAISTPQAWSQLETQFVVTRVVRLDVDVHELVCDSAGLSLLYHLSVGGMTPGATVNLTGLSPELQHL